MRFSIATHSGASIGSTYIAICWTTRLMATLQTFSKTWLQQWFRHCYSALCLAADPYLGITPTITRCFGKPKKLTHSTPGSVRPSMLLILIIYDFKGYAHCRQPLLEQALRDFVYMWIRSSWFCVLNGLWNNGNSTTAWNGRSRTAWNGKSRTAWNGKSRTAWNRNSRTAWTGKSRLSKIVPNRLRAFLGQLLAHGVLPVLRGGNGCLMVSTERAGAHHIANVWSKTMSPSNACSKVDKRIVGQRSPFLRKTMFRGERARIPSPKTPLVLSVMSLESL